MTGIHAGHRERLRTRATTEGLSSFQPHEVLELLLMQVIPQRDVNPLAHVLIDSFGTVGAVLAAEEETLTRIPGVGARTARWLRAAGSLLEAYNRAEPPKTQIVTKLSEATQFMQREWQHRTCGYLLLCMDQAGRVLHAGSLETDGNGAPSLQDALRTALRYHAQNAVSARMTAVCDGFLTKEEWDFVHDLSEGLALYDILYLDHIVFSKDAYFSATRASRKNRSQTIGAHTENAAAESVIPAARSRRPVMSEPAAADDGWLEGETDAAPSE